MEKNTKNLVERQLFPKIIKHLERPEISIIIGPRQTGKTTLLKQVKDYLLKKGHKEANVLVFNLDIITELELFTTQQQFISFLKERVGKEKLFVFVDEAQRIKNAGIFFKGIYDLNLPIKFILTGSSTLEIKSRVHESLAGRKRVFQLYPFSFSEYLSAYDSTLTALLFEKEISPYSRARIMEYLFTFINWGGYPKIALETNISEKQQELKEVFSSYVEKDIIGFLKIRNPSVFTNLAVLVSAQIGQLLNVNTICQTLRIERKTVEKYLEILEKTFVVKMIPPFFRNQRKEITKMPKNYFIDTGLRNFAVKSFQDFITRQDKGVLLENFVFSEILKQTDSPLHFWRTKEKAEVDFVLVETTGKLLPIEIKSTALKSPEISRSLRGFITRYQPPQAFVVNLGLQQKINLNKTAVNFIYPYEIEKVVAKK